jgi:hypothetical protein
MVRVPSRVSREDERNFVQRKLLVAALVVLAANAVVGVRPAAAATPAKYHGRTIDVSKDWEGAMACAVLSPGDVQCFDSQAELEEALGGGGQDAARGNTSAASSDSASAASPMTASSYCLGLSTYWLVLYEHSSFGGRSLSFRDQTVWQDLTAYTFNDQMSSWINNTFCDAYASWDTGGGGVWLTMSARSSSTYVGATWNDQASSIYIT